jgi:phage terminase large subunit-like protein
VNDIDIVTWAEQQWCPPSLGGRPIVLELHQKRILSHVFERDGSGRFRYETILWSEPKKSGKTELNAMVSFYLALVEGPFSEVYCHANDLEQSKGRAFSALTRAVRRFPEVKVQVDRVLLPDGGVIQAVPCDYQGAAGANPTLTSWDELWGYTSESSRRLWDEMSPVPTRRNSMRLVTSYAGYTGESELLEELYHMGLEGKPVPGLEDIDNGGDGEPACRAAGGLFFFWSHKPRMPWQDESYYERQRSAPGFRETAYLRLHENRWQQPEGEFVPMALWDACQGPVPTLSVDTPRLVVGVDAGHKHDGFAITIVSRHPNPALREQAVAVRAVKVWEPPRGGEVDFALPFKWLQAFCAVPEHRVYKVVYDSWQLIDWAARFQKEAGVLCEPFSQQGRREQADAMLYEMVRAGRVLHDGDATLTEHMRAASFRVRGEAERGRLVKGPSGKLIDAAVSLSMATAEAMRLYL